MSDGGTRRSGPRRLSVTVTAPGLRTRPAPGLAAWLAGAAPASARGAVDVAIVSDARMRRLNAAFRGIDAVTDVLSFPADASHRPVAAGPGVPLLGDIVMAVGVARRQAAAEGHALGTELRVLALHGLLHLLGYDHERDRGRMRRLEERLRRRAGLPGGLIDRTARRATRA